MAVDNEQKLDELGRKLGVQEAELKRGLERAELAEKNLKVIEEELETVGENMKQLENLLKRLLRGKRSWLRRSFLCRTSTRLLRLDLSTEVFQVPQDRRDEVEEEVIRLQQQEDKEEAHGW